LEDEEATNVRLREDSESTMMFDFTKLKGKKHRGGPSGEGPINLNQVEVDI